MNDSVKPGPCSVEPYLLTISRLSSGTFDLNSTEWRLNACVTLIFVPSTTGLVERTSVSSCQLKRWPTSKLSSFVVATLKSNAYWLLGQPLLPFRAHIAPGVG